jgi:hypothetical protein
MSSRKPRDVRNRAPDSFGELFRMEPLGHEGILSWRSDKICQTTQAAEKVEGSGELSEL